MLTTLIETNPYILTVNLQAVSVAPLEKFTLAISSHPRIQNYSLTCGRISRNIDMFLLTLPQLTRLAITHPDFQEYAPLNFPQSLPKLQTLTFVLMSRILENQIESIFNLIKVCPNLKKLGWGPIVGGGPDDRSFSRICKELTKTCPKIEELDIYGKFTDENISQIIGSTGSHLKSIAFTSTGFGPHALKSCERFFGTLKSIRLMKCPRVSSSMIQQILTSCPQLTILSTTEHINASDIFGINQELQSPINGTKDPTSTTTLTEVIRPIDWVCLNMEYLHLPIVGFANKPQFWHNMVLQQLGRLTKLRWLDTSVATTLPNDELEVCQQTGIAALINLKKLEYVHFGCFQFMVMEDIFWMVESWPRLAKIGGKLEVPKKKRSQFDRYLKNQSTQRTRQYLNEIIS
ncbi:hypothetical protein BGZ76_000320 [Entomortierella beljakovae]|nr:hypothetical protein BGZ76_000320 [Entomortierella beljakovae]